LCEIHNEKDLDCAVFRFGFGGGNGDAQPVTEPRMVLAGGGGCGAAAITSGDRLVPVVMVMS
jgi:hypothetical protein